MFRARVALFAALAVWPLLPGAAFAQAIRRPAPRSPRAAYRPTSQTTPPSPTARRPIRPGGSAAARSAFQFTPLISPAGGGGFTSRNSRYRHQRSPQRGYDYGYSFFNPAARRSSGVYYPHGFSFFDPPPDAGTLLLPPPLQGAGGPANSQSLPPRPTPLAARLDLQLPAAAEVWMDGELQPGRSATWELTSLPLPHPWSAHLFDVAARWSVGGQEFEWENKVPVIAGHTGQALVARGLPVKR